MRRPWILATLALASTPLARAGDDKPPVRWELALPVRLEAGGKPIDTAVGHAAPFVGDFDGDGVKDLLVGQFGDGLLTIYRNVGTDAAPRLAAGAKFKDGGQDGRVPTG